MTPRRIQEDKKQTLGGSKERIHQTWNRMPVKVTDGVKMWKEMEKKDEEGTREG